MVDDCRRKLLKCPSWRLVSRCQLLHDLSDAFYDRFKQLGRMEHLEEAIRCQRQALALRPPDRSMSPNILAFFLRTRFKHLGRMEDLEEAITCMWPSSACSPTSRTSWSFNVSQQPCHIRVHSLSAIGKNGGFGGGDHMSSSSACSPTPRTSQSFIFSQQPCLCVSLVE